MKSLNDLGPMIVRLREKAGLTRKELSERVPMDYKQLAEYERGEVVPTEKSLRRLAAVLPIREEE